MWFFSYPQASVLLVRSPAGSLVVELQAYLLWQRPTHPSCPFTREYLRTHLDYKAQEREFENIFQAKIKMKIPLLVSASSLSRRIGTEMVNTL